MADRVWFSFEERADLLRVRIHRGEDVVWTSESRRPGAGDTGRLETLRNVLHTLANTTQEPDLCSPHPDGWS